METLEIKTAEGTAEIVVREGQALPLKEPVKVDVSGVIDSPLKWLEKRVSEIDQKKCHIIVNRDNMQITLKLDEKNHYQDKVTGALQIHPDLGKWKINSGHTWEPKQLSEFIKMNRSAFGSRDVAMRLSKELMDIKVNVQKEFERSDNNRGDYKAMVAQKVISSNIPESFKLELPVFKGDKKREFEVEIYVSPDSYGCSFVSPEINDIIHDVRDTIIDEQIGEIKKLAEDIVIIEQ